MFEKWKEFTADLHMGNICIISLTFLSVNIIGIALQIFLSKLEDPWIGLAIPALWTLPALFLGLYVLNIAIKQGFKQFYFKPDYDTLFKIGLAIFLVPAIINSIIYFMFHN